MTDRQREFDVVLQGVTGFTGRLTAEYLLERFGAGGELRWALAGRSSDKLENVRKGLADEIGAGAAALPLIVADANDADAMRAMAERTTVVCSTVGPYALYGSALVAACAASGTDYCDLTGEVQWMRRMIDTHQDTAVASGARIVHSCGFDSIPSDLGVYLVQLEMRNRHGVSSPRVKLRVAAMDGGASGGTIASMLAMMDEAERDPGVKTVLADPYALNPKDQRSGPDSADATAPRFDDDFDQWIAPFAMAGINTRIVRRSNALLDHRYGADFRYDEAVLSGRGPLGMARAAAVAAATGGAMAAASVGALRRRFGRFLPQPGDGPSKTKREAGHFDLEVLAIHPDDEKKNVRMRILGDRDPGYGSTSKMLGEAAVCLAQDARVCGGGFHTPASAMGDGLAKRLPAHAGVTFAIED